MKLFSQEFNGLRHLLNPERKYVKAIDTDVAATFKRIQAEMAAAKPAKVVGIKGKGKS